MDGLHGDDAQIHMEVPETQMSMHYMHDHDHGLHHMSNGDGMDDDHDNGGNGRGEGIDGDVTNDPGNVSDGHGAMIQAVTDNNQLTLSFQGQVQTVLLLLGGREVPAMPAIPVNVNHNNRAISTNPQRLNVPQRLASLIRFREKKKERSFDKKIRYTVRKEVALRMQRNKGQFTSSKPVQEDSSSSANNWDSSQSWETEGNASQPQEISCRHCGISEKSTPMMRRGPEGPKTLCNACGLMWANKGTLRDLSKAPIQVGQNSSMEGDGNFNNHHQMALPVSQNAEDAS
ncbi:hypothetical protein V2J09_003570 [Rumex salicifolius]